MVILASLAALVLAQLLPGLLLVKLFDIGRDREERWIVAAILSGPLAAAIYWITLVTDWSPLYWILLANVALAAVVLPFRSPASWGWTPRSRFVIAAVAGLVFTAYLLTTGSTYLPDAEGNLVLDPALQRDVLFHIGIIRSLEHAYPPALLSVSGLPIGYHVGYHLQLAAWARFFGIDAIDGLIRLGTLWQLALLLTSAHVLARRFSESGSTRLLAPISILGSGLGFLFFFRPSVEWWSLTFMDVSLVSILLANPYLPALPLLFVGLALFDDYVRALGRGALAASVVCFAFILVVKMFLGVQLLAALAMAAITRFRDRRLSIAALVTAVASVPFLFHTFVAAESSNTSVVVRPLEIVRYSMEKLDWQRAIDAVAAVGRFEPPSVDWLTALVATGVWIVGFLGLRLVALPGWAVELFNTGSALRRTMAWFVAVGFPVALVFRIAPAEAEGLSRLEAQNDVIWFAAASGLFLWFWAAERLRGRLAIAAVVLLALPATVQHFVHAGSLEPDRIGIGRVLTARTAALLSAPDSIWLDPPDRVRPSLLPYLAGRAVVHDPFVGYDYMFVGRDEIDFRRHAVAQFWSGSDPGYRAWFLDHFDVDFLWQQGVDLGPLVGLEALYTGDTVVLFRVHGAAIGRAALSGITTPTSIPLGGRGSPYLGSGFRREGRVRALEPGRTRLYIPRAAERPLSIRLLAEPQHSGGELVLDEEPVVVSSGQMRIAIELPPREVPGLHAIEVEWRSDRPLIILEIELE